MTTDILADLEATVRPRGNPCRVAVMRRDRPDLSEQWDRVMEAKRTATTRAGANDIARWFTDREFSLSRAVVETHIKGACEWCRRGLVA